ncbi:MAG: hypothetical protein ACOYIK_08055 [Coriobacteriales bacterium]|jgi:hypothetical protein
MDELGTTDGFGLMGVEAAAGDVLVVPDAADGTIVMEIGLAVSVVSVEDDLDEDPSAHYEWPAQMVEPSSSIGAPPG